MINAATQDNPTREPAPFSPGFMQGKRLLVTGAASGIGKSTAMLAAQLGATVIAADLNQEAADLILAGLGDSARHSSVMVDVSNAESVGKLFAHIDEMHGGIDAVIHCAGIWFTKEDRSITRTTEEVWDKTINVNLKGTFLICREAIARMEKQGGGSIVTVASVAALVGFERITAYTASKGGVQALTRQMAIDYAPKNIRINCICPGVIETGMTAQVLEHAQPTVLPIGRVGKPDEIARTALFLCSDWSSFTTASTVVIDGGFTAA